MATKSRRIWTTKEGNDNLARSLRGLSFVLVLYRGTSLIRLYRSQAKVQGQDVTWLVPYEFGQNLPEASLNPQP